MMKKLVLATLLLAGCTSGSKYIEGTSLQLGAYVPWESNIYGVELVSYVNGCLIKAHSNTCFTVDRSFNATNEYFWGMVKTIESVKTKVDTHK